MFNQLFLGYLLVRVDNCLQRCFAIQKAWQRAGMASAERCPANWRSLQTARSKLSNATASTQNDHVWQYPEYEFANAFDWLIFSSVNHKCHSSFKTNKSIKHPVSSKYSTTRRPSSLSTNSAGSPFLCSISLCGVLYFWIRPRSVITIGDCLLKPKRSSQTLKSPSDPDRRELFATQTCFCVPNKFVSSLFM
jgi:hypothetical protein